MSVEWIKKGLAKSGKSQAGLARALRLDPAQVSRLLSGQRRLKADEIAIVANYLGETPMTVLSAEELELVESYRVADASLKRAIQAIARSVKGGIAQPPPSGSRKRPKGNKPQA